MTKEDFDSQFLNGTLVVEVESERQSDYIIQLCMKNLKGCMSVRTYEEYPYYYINHKHQDLDAMTKKELALHFSKADICIRRKDMPFLDNYLYNEQDMPLYLIDTGVLLPLDNPESKQHLGYDETYGYKTENTFYAYDLNSAINYVNTCVEDTQTDCYAVISFPKEQRRPVGAEQEPKATDNILYCIKKESGHIEKDFLTLNQNTLSI